MIAIPFLKHWGHSVLCNPNYRVSRLFFTGFRCGLGNRTYRAWGITGITNLNPQDFIATAPALHPENLYDSNPLQKRHTCRNPENSSVLCKPQKRQLSFFVQLNAYNHTDYRKFSTFCIGTGIAFISISTSFALWR